MIGRHPTNHSLKLWQRLLVAPLVVCMVAIFVVLVISSAAVETVSDWRRK